MKFSMALWFILIFLGLVLLFFSSVGLRLTISWTTDEPQTERHFSLKRLPIEIRRRVYGQYFQGVFRVEGKAGIVISVKKALLCSCLSPEGRYSPQNMTILNISLAFTCKALHQEVLTHWYQTHMFYFGCGCDLSKYCIHLQMDT